MSEPIFDNLNSFLYLCVSMVEMVKKSDFWDAKVQKMHIFLDIKKTLWHHLGSFIENTSAKFQSCSINHTGEIFPRVSATSSKKHKLRNDAWKARMASGRNKDNANVLMHLMHFAVYASTKWGSRLTKFLLKVYMVEKNSVLTFL